VRQHQPFFLPWLLPRPDAANEELSRNNCRAGPLRLISASCPASNPLAQLASSLTVCRQRPVASRKGKRGRQHFVIAKLCPVDITRSPCRAGSFVPFHQPCLGPWTSLCTGDPVFISHPGDRA